MPVTEEMQCTVILCLACMLCFGSYVGYGHDLLFSQLRHWLLVIFVTKALVDCSRGSDIQTKASWVGLPTLDCAVEVLGHGKCRLHSNSAISVAAILADKQVRTQMRTLKDGKLIVQFEQGSAMHDNGSRANEANWLAELATKAQSFRSDQQYH